MKKTDVKHHFIGYYILTGALFLLLISHHFLTKGMFLDGIYYAAIAHNMANGYGTFWDPFFSATVEPHFYSHPPLVFGIESLFFKIFGDSYLIEKGYSVLTYLLTAWFIVLIWHQSGYSKKSGWIPLLCWICMPLMSWAAPNNLLENTMTVFIMASTWCYLKSVGKSSIIWILFGSLPWLGAILCKGPTALFIAVLPFFYRLLNQPFSWKKLLRDEVLWIGGLCVWAGLLIAIQPECLHYFARYWDTQIRSCTQTLTAPNRVYILKAMVDQLILPVILVGLLLLYQRLSRRHYAIAAPHNRNRRRLALCYLLTALSGVIPIMISLKQRNFYLLSTLPFFSLSLAIVAESVLQPEKWQFSRFQSIGLWVGVLLFSGGSLAWAISQYGTYGRDETRLRDIERTLPYMPAGSTIILDPALKTEWNLYSYYARMKRIGLKVGKPVKRFYITEEPTPPAEGYTLLTAANKELFLFEDVSNREPHPKSSSAQSQP